MNAKNRNPDPTEDLKSEAIFESQGKFTLDPSRALDKVQQRLLQPEDCLLYLLQAAVASRATWARLNWTRTEFFFEHDGYFPTPEEMEGATNWPLDATMSVERQRWGMALAAALTPPGLGLVADYADGRSVAVRSGQVEPLPGEIRPGPVVRIPVRTPWWGRLWGLSGSPWVKRLRERGRFAPLHLTIAGQLVSEQPFGEEDLYASPELGISWGPGKTPNAHHHLLEMRFSATSEQDWMSLPLRRTATAILDPHRIPMRSMGKDPHLVSACQAVMLARVQGAPTVTLIQHGVSLKPVEVPAWQEGFQLLLADSRLSTDLTCLAVVRDDRFTEAVQAYSRPFEEAYRLLWEAYQSEKARDFPLWVASKYGRQRVHE